jgi:hypothetical protein
MDPMQLQHAAACNVVRSRGCEDRLALRGHFVVEHFRNGEKIGQYEFDNQITNEGKNALLNVMFHGATPITTWYLGLVDGSGTPTLAAGDTYAQIGGSNGWVEFTSYSEATRLAWGPGAAASQSITNSTPVVFDIT